MDLQLQLEAAGCHSHSWPCSCWPLCARCCACFLTAHVWPHSWCAALPPITPLPGECGMSHVLRHLCSSSNFWFLLFLLVAAKGGNPFHPSHSLTVSAGVRDDYYWALYSPVKLPCTVGTPSCRSTRRATREYNRRKSPSSNLLGGRTHMSASAESLPCGESQPRDEKGKEMNLTQCW